MADCDLILIRRGENIAPYRPTADLSKKLRNGVDVRLLGILFKSYGPCCEWLEVIDVLNRNPIGVAFVDFYERDDHETIAGLRAKNVTWEKDGGATFLFSETKEWQAQAGPYLPVHFYGGDREQCCYFVPEGLSTEYKMKVNELPEG